MYRTLFSALLVLVSTGVSARVISPGVITPPILPTHYCSYNWKSTAGGDLAITNVVPPTGEVDPGGTFNVIVTVKNESTGCVADSGWEVHLETSTLSLGSKIVNTSLAIGASRQVTVTGTIPASLHWSVDSLSVTARVAPNNFLDGIPSNNTSAPFTVTIAREAIVDALSLQQVQVYDGGSTWWERKVTLKNIGTGATCDEAYGFYLWVCWDNSGVTYCWPGAVDADAPIDAINPGQSRAIKTWGTWSNPYCLDDGEYWLLELLQAPNVSDECRDAGSGWTLGTDWFGQQWLVKEFILDEVNQPIWECN